MLDALLHHKKPEKQYLCALVISSDCIDAALWETDTGGDAKVLKTAHAEYEGEWENAINAADKTVTEIESSLPEGTELTKVVFGLFPQWLSEDHIKEIYLKKLKQLTTALSLTPVGFVELPTAVAHLLQKDEGAQQTVILVGVEKQYVTVSLFKIGKLIGSKSSSRTSNISTDVEKAIAAFTDVEVLPSRMLLYGTSDRLEAIKADMLSYPWQKKVGFLHFPKIEALEELYAVRAVAIASATELTPHVEEKNGEVESQDSASSETAEPPSINNSVGSVTDDLGFVKEENGEERLTEPETENEKGEEMAVAIPQNSVVENVAPVERMPMDERKRSQPRFQFPKLTFTFRWPRFNSLRLLLAIVMFILLVGGTAAAAFWILPQATVTVLVEPKLFDKSEQITIDVSRQEVDTEGKVLPGTIQKLEVSGSQTVAATGKKTVGEKAQGEVTIFNKTLNVKTFKKGTAVTSGKLAFTLDQEVTVASASENVGSLTYGNAKATLTAAVIGTASNLPAESEFIFDQLPGTSYTARNEKALSGGTSREISVVARDDQKTAREAAVDELKKQAEDQLKQKIPDGEKLLDNSLQTEVASENFSKEVGEESKDLTITVSVKVEAATYNEAQFSELLKTIISGQIAQGYEYHEEDVKTSIDEITIVKEGVWKFKPHMQIKLLPKIETKEFAVRLVGKSLDDATAYLKSQPGISGVEYDVVTPFGFLKQKLPMNPGRITISINSL